MREGVPQQFSNPQEEIEYLRHRIAERERALLSRTPEIDSTDRETVGRQEIREYTSFTPQMVLHKEYAFKPEDVAHSAEAIKIALDPVEEILTLAQEKGIKNALTVLSRVENAFVVDEVHRKLIELVQSGVQLADLKEGMRPWHLLHMTLYEVTMPEQIGPNGQKYQIAELVGMMQQLFSGLRTIGSVKPGNHFVIEVAVADHSSYVVFYVSVPNEFTALFEKQTHSLFPNAVLTVQPHDYNIYIDQGTTVAAEFRLMKHSIYPLKKFEDFSADPLAVLLNAFSKIDHEGTGAAIQFVIRHPAKIYREKFQDIIKDVENGMSPKQAINHNTFSGEFMSIVADAFKNKKKEEEEKPKQVDQQVLERLKSKIATELVEVNIRMVVSSKDSVKAQQIITQIQSTFNQFNDPLANSFVTKTLKGKGLLLAQKAFAFRQFSKKRAFVLSIAELATLIHFPANGIESTPQFKQSHAKTAPAPNVMPTEGTLLGVNRHRGIDVPIYITEKDRMRHFYVIGQTGTGKSVFLQNLIVQDIKSGAGVCMIDPHGTDIEDVLGTIPPEREQDVIYFDPSRMDRVIGLNMLEYDYSKPEQKTFVVNELFSIFQKLYGANPESMGPMFEQYFRNATMLVMEDPESGNTLMDISRVMADAQYRRKKLEKATNPVVVQFWKEIATKAGGEASLENIVPYIVSKFDVFTANDYMRPIIGQQQSAFNFRQIMDEKKILLVNLSKGRLGEINSNLIGMIFVGKILMAALSRVDDPTKSFPPFYLHIDEFQNISTPAIASILSEARKYKLGLTMAHQFIAQLDPTIRDAVFGNVGSMAAFRVGNEDSQALEAQFAPSFTAADIMNTPNYNAVVRVLANGVPAQPFSLAAMPPPDSSPARVAELIEYSIARYGRPRDEVEADIRARYQKPAPPPPPMPPQQL